MIELLEESINRVLQGPFDFRAANSIGFLAGIHLKALNQRGEEPTDRIENEQKAITSLPRTKVEEEVLGHELMRLVVGLDQDKHPAAKLEAIKAAYVVNGTLETNSTRRVSPPEDPANPSDNIYTSLFERLRSGAPNEQEVFELFPPQPPQKDADIAPGLLPAPGESIDDPPTPPSNHPRVITVEIG